MQDIPGQFGTSGPRVAWPPVDDADRRDREFGGSAQDEFVSRRDHHDVEACVARHFDACECKRLIADDSDAHGLRRAIPIRYIGSVRFRFGREGLCSQVDLSMVRRGNR